MLAPDKFKGCLTAAEVAAAVADGLRAARPEVVTVARPVADGGDGTVAAAVAAGYAERRVTVEGPTGMPVEAPYALAGSRAVVELAAACGLDRLPDGRPDPLGASTYGLGQVIGAALDDGATSVVVGLGGSASTDGGVGLVQALGARVLDAQGDEVGRGAGGLAAVDSLDLTGLRRRLAGVSVVVACDVDNPLLGPRGAASVFGPQKGAGPAEVGRLEAGLARWAEVVAAETGRDASTVPGAGAAGGAGFAAVALLDAELRPGIDLILDLLDFDSAVRAADLVVTGEGSLDEQSLAGKAPVGVARRTARSSDAPVVAVAGRSRLDQSRLASAGIRVCYPLSDLEPDL
ncbi:MAG: glycerate kinase, partial [Actinomycetes bacterium]